MKNIILWVTFLLLSIYNVSPCSENCYECDKNTTCIACAQPFQRTASGQCIRPTIDNCILYGTLNQCYKCEPTFRLSNNQCIKQFSGCVRYSTTNKCLECGFGLQLSNDNCVGIFNCNKTDSNKSCSQCNDGYTLENNLCKYSMANCTQIDTKTGACKQCYQDNVLSGYRCVPTYIAPEFCYVYDSNGRCLFCKEGFTSLEGVCYTSGEIQKIYVSQNVRARRIIKTASSSANGNQETSLSVSGSQNISSSSQKNQPELNQLNNSQKKPANPIDRCLRYDQSLNRCLMCENLYVLVNQICYFGIEGCLSYQVAAKTVLCRQCSQNYELEPKTSICLLKQEDVIKDCLIPSLSKLSCVVCNQGFVEKNGQCVSKAAANIAQPQRRNCGSFDDVTKKCKTCVSQEFKLENGMCLDVNCDKFNSSIANQCILCKSYFQLNSVKGQCEYKDINCERVFGQRCSQCSKGYFIVEAGYCTLIPYGCEIPNIKTGQCSICQSNFMLLLNGTCRQQLAIQNCQTLETNQNAINKCASCIDGFYPSFDSCKKVSSRCNSYDKDSGYCIGCLAPFFLTKGKCLDENCLKESVSVIDSCEICKDGFVLKNGLCRFDDANCQVVQNNTCALCLTGYSFVVSRNKCILNLAVSGQNKNQLQKQQLSQKTLPNQTKPSLNILQESSATISPQSLNLQTFTKSWDQPSNSEQQIAKNNSQSQISAINTLRTSPSQQMKNTSNQSQLSAQSQTSATRNNIKIENCLYQNPINTKICLECQKNYTPSADYLSCVSTLRIPANTIQKDPNCQSFQSPFKCKKCNDRFYLSSVTNRCTQVNQVCNTYDNSTGACLTCFEGFEIEAGKCYLKVQIDPYCMQKALEGCSKCVDGYFADKNKGKKCQKLTPYCSLWNQESGKCSVCKQGYSLVNGQCLNLVDDPNCLSFVTNDKRICQKCVDTYFVNTMTAKCQKINENCKTYNATTGQCYTCKADYKLSKGLCQKTLALENFVKDYFCKTLQKNVCSECYKGYYLNLQNVCKQKNPICKDIAIQNGDCTQCYDGYYLVSGACVLPSNLHVNTLSLNKNCKTFASTEVNSCKQCYSGYRLSGGVCLQTNQLCKTFDPKTGLCTYCYDGYYLQAGSCLINLANNPNELDPYCTELSKDFTFCVKCAPGYFVGDSGSCQPLDPSFQCETYTAEGKCGTCSFGYIMTNKKVCIQEVLYCTQYNKESICVECGTGFYVKQNQCFPTDIKCQSYDIKSQTCNKCIPGHILFQNQCIYPTFGPDRLCTKYLNSFCTECAIGSYLFNYRCREIDINCSKFDYQAKRCIDCKNKLKPRGISCVSEN